jgi:hypothetical protein
MAAPRMLIDVAGRANGSGYGAVPPQQRRHSVVALRQAPQSVSEFCPSVGVPKQRFALLVALALLGQLPEHCRVALVFRFFGGEVLTHPVRPFGRSVNSLTNDRFRRSLVCLVVFCRAPIRGRHDAWG